MELSFSQTQKYCLNQSSTKQQYSFMKQQRFKKRSLTQPKSIFYKIPSLLNLNKQKCPSFPKTVRKLQFPEQKSKLIVPSPSSYKIKSQIQQSIKKGISIPKQQIRKRKQIKTPGPGNYTPRNQSFSNVKYTIMKSKKKLQYPLFMQNGKQSPGPAYLVNVRKLQNVVGKYVQRKCMKVYSQRVFKVNSIIDKNYSSILKNNSIIQKNKSQILKHHKLNPQDNISLKRNPQNNSTLLQRLPNLKNQKSANFFELKKSSLGKFGKCQRKSIFDKKNQNPGPSYNHFSQFSRLQKKMYNDKLKRKNLLKSIVIK